MLAVVPIALEGSGGTSLLRAVVPAEVTCFNASMLTVPTLFLGDLSETDRFLDVWAVLSSFCLRKQTVCPLGTSRRPLKPRDHPGFLTYTPCQICPT